MHMHAVVTKVLLHQNLVDLLRVFHMQIASLEKAMAQLMVTINVSCLMPHLCITLKTSRATQEGRSCYRTILFPVIRRYCTADAKIFVVSFTFATQKLTKKTPKHLYNLSSFQYSHTSLFICINTWDSGTSKHAVRILWFTSISP